MATLLFHHRQWHLAGKNRTLEDAPAVGLQFHPHIVETHANRRHLQPHSSRHFDMIRACFLGYAAALFKLYDMY